MDAPKLFDSMFLSPFKRHISKDKSKMTVPFLVQPYSWDSKSRMKTKKFKEDYSGYFLAWKTNNNFDCKKRGDCLWKNI